MMSERTKDTLAAVGWISVVSGLGHGLFQAMTVSPSIWDLGYEAVKVELWICGGLFVLGALCMAPALLSKE
jgi:hypothetical protein